MVEEIQLKKVRTSEELTFDMVSAPGFILEKVDWGTIQGEHNTYRYVNQVGETVVSTSLGKRPISITGWVVSSGYQDMSKRKRILNKFINPQDLIEAYYKGYKIQFLPDSTIRYATSNKDNNDVLCKFKIMGTCYNPMFSDRVEHQSVFATTEPHFHFPLVIPRGKGVIFGARTESLIAKVVNEGSVPVGMRIVFKANGTLVNPKIINVVTQEKFIVNKTLSVGEEVTVVTTTGKKKVSGRIGNGPSINYYAYRDYDSSWLQLDVGVNVFRYDADSGLDNLEVSVYFSNEFLEVEE